MNTPIPDCLGRERTERKPPRLATALALAGIGVAWACTSDSGPPQGASGETTELWFHREPSRPDPPPPPAPEIIKKELPPGAKEGVQAGFVVPMPPAVDEDNVLTWLPGSSSDTVTLKSGMSNYSLTGATIQGSARTAIIAYQGGGPYVGTSLRDCLIHVAPNTVPDGRSFWAFRGYDMSDTSLVGVEITGFGKVTHKHDEGHAIYLNVVGSLTLEDCNIHHNGGQGLQLVNRPYESNLAKGPAAGAITVRNSWFKENGFNPDRGAFQVSIFGTGQDVTLDGVQILAGQDDTSYPDGRTGGALLIEAEAPRDDKDNAWWWPLKKGEEEAPFTNGTVLLNNLLVDHEQPNRALVQIKGCRELTVTKSTFNGGRVLLDDPSKAGRNSGKITWSGNSGDAIVYLNGHRVGPADQDFTAENGVVQ